MKPCLKMGGNLKKIIEMFVRDPTKNKNMVGIINMNERSIEEGRQHQE